jgi:hypothetical protein
MFSHHKIYILLYLNRIMEKGIKGVDYPGVTVVFFCHDGNGNFLMNKRSKNCRDEQGRWDIGGGGLEVHDTVIGTLKEEIMQEYCTDVLDYEFLSYRDVHRENNGIKTHWVGLDFRVLVDKSKVKNGEPHKFEDIRGFRLDNMPPIAQVHSQFPEFLRLYMDKLRK